MKKCEYCAKEISYFEQFCSDECQINSNKFYEKEEKFSKLFGVINTICVFGIPIGIFVFSLLKYVGIVLATGSCEVLGLAILIMPFPTENMISKYKLKKAVRLTRIFAGVLMLFGVVLFLFMFFFSV